MRNVIATGTAGALLALALALAQGAPTFAQDAPVDGTSTDPFAPGAFEAGAGTAAPSAAAGESAQAAAQAKTEYLVGGTAAISASAYLPLDSGGYALSSQVAGKLFAKVSVPDYGSLYISYALSMAWFEGLSGTVPGSAALVPPLDLSSATYALSELYYSFDIDKLLFARLGKQLLAWGPSQVWSPVDFVNAQRFNVFAPVDLRQGKSGLRLHVPLSKANAFLFSDFSGLVAGGEVLDPVDAVNLAGRFDYTLGGFEFGLSGIAGKSVQGRFGADFSGDFLGTAVYGELALSPAYSSYESSVLASLGFSRQLGELKRLTISGEGFYSSTGSDLSGQGLEMAKLPSLYIGRYYGYLSLQAKELLSSYLASTLYGLANLSDLSYSINIREDFSFPRAVPFSLILGYTGGGAEKEFTFIGGDKAFSLSLRTRMEF
jgi:hypothetical protein